MNALDGILVTVKDLTKRVARLETQGRPQWVYLTTPLTSTSWDGDARSTTAKSIIDLSSVFSVPAGVKAIAVFIEFRDSASAAGATYFGLAPNDTADLFAVATRFDTYPNDSIVAAAGICPCDANGDVYYQVAASGASTADVWLWIWGYMI